MLGSGFTHNATSNQVQVINAGSDYTTVEVHGELLLPDVGFHASLQTQWCKRIWLNETLLIMSRKWLREARAICSVLLIICSHTRISPDVPREVFHRFPSSSSFHFISSARGDKWCPHLVTNSPYPRPEYEQYRLQEDWSSSFRCRWTPESCPGELAPLCWTTDWWRCGSVTMKPFRWAATERSLWINQCSWKSKATDNMLQWFVCCEINPCYRALSVHSAIEARLFVLLTLWITEVRSKLCHHIYTGLHTSESRNI